MNIPAWIKSFFTKSEDKKVSQLQLTVLSNSQPADGATPCTVQVKVFDIDANATTSVSVVGVTVNFSVSAGKITPSQAITDENGQAMVSVLSTVAGPVTLTTSLADGTTQQTTLNFVAVPEVNPAPAAPTAAPALSPLDKAKNEFEAFVEFVEHGIKVLGADAEAELVALKDKYL